MAFKVCPVDRHHDHKENEDEKKKEYTERVLNVEKGNFTPLVFLTSRGMSKECKRFLTDSLWRCGKGSQNQAEICPSQNSVDSPERPP